MIILNVLQGTDEWLEEKAKYPHSASEATAMMGLKPQMKRNEMIMRRATGLPKEYSSWTEEVLFPNGHLVEAAARPLAEAFIGEELFPQVATDDDGYLLASFDGINMAESIVWECKTWNEQKAIAVRDGEVPADDVWQVIQQLVISGAERALYTLSNGTPEKTLHVWRGLWPGERDKLLSSWHQFDEDVKNHQHVEEAPKLEGKAPETLPALHIELTGMVAYSNLAEFKQVALSVIDAVNDELETDQDFADAKKAVIWCKDVKARCRTAKTDALSKTADIAAVLNTLDEIEKYADLKRINITKKIDDNNITIRLKIANAAKVSYAEYVSNLEKTIKPMRLPALAVDFASAMKNKRTIASLHDSVDTLLSYEKVKAAEVANTIALNLQTITELANDQRHLFSDLQQIIAKPTEDFTATVKLRLAEHKEKEQKRLEAERERIRQEEKAKARRVAEAEREKIRVEEQAKAIREAEAERERIRGEEAIKAREQAALEVDLRPLVETVEATKMRERGEGYLGGVNMSNEASFEFQRGKTAEATHAGPKATARPQEPAASTPPITMTEAVVRYEKPSDIAIVEVLSRHYGVTSITIIAWLLDMDLNEISAKIIANGF